MKKKKSYTDNQQANQGLVVQNQGQHYLFATNNTGNGIFDNLVIIYLTS